MGKARNILILGGTFEAAELAKSLVGSSGASVTTSLAGRTSQPLAIAGEVRTGGFGGAAGLADYLLKHNIDLLIDATHPFAAQISRNAIAAAKLSGVTLEIKLRPPWTKQPRDNWTCALDLTAAANLLPRGARAFLALGSQYLDVFRPRSDVFFIVRMVDAPSQPLSLQNHVVILGRPGIERNDEAILFQQTCATHIVCRNSGGVRGYAKIEAARDLGLDVIMIERPIAIDG